MCINPWVCFFRLNVDLNEEPEREKHGRMKTPLNYIEFLCARL